MGDTVVSGGLVVDGTGRAPRPGNVVVRGGRIAAVLETGSPVPSEAEVVDAEGCIVTPGFVDVHTHYDGQATWDPEMAPSSWHGITTVVMGNCGVGFAPARPDSHEWLIELMEGVEDIPGTALADGMTWNWESFPEYLDELARLPRTIDVAAQTPHGALRAYVMGERGATSEQASAEDLLRMAALVEEASQAGAVAFSTNRLAMHTSLTGVPVPGTFADYDELVALAQGVARAGHGVIQVVPAGSMGDDPDAPLREVELYRRVSITTGLPLTFTTVELHPNPEQWRLIMEAVEEANGDGAQLVPQVAGRPAGLLASWDTFNPFKDRPAYLALHDLPLVARVAELRREEVRSQILSQGDHDGAGMGIMRHSLGSAFPMVDGPVFEPGREESIAGLAEARGIDPIEVLYDSLCDSAEAAIEAAGDGGPEAVKEALGFIQVYFAGYRYGNLDAMVEMMRHPAAVVGLADGGAHCGVICDASLPTFVLQHLVRDRQRGPRLALEEAVAMLSARPAAVYGFEDRGTLEVGRRADLNVIDLDGLELHNPRVVHDLPTGARRLVQSTAGYRTTMCAGEVTFRNGAVTDARPGRLVRGT